jgi:hypothetical protein
MQTLDDAVWDRLDRGIENAAWPGRDHEPR